MLIPSPLRLDQSAHRAFLQTSAGERELVRATTALADVGIIGSSEYFTPESLARGQRIHAASHRFFSRGLGASQLPESDRGYWDGVLRFVEETGFVCVRCEDAVYDEVEGYAGCYDLFGELPQLPPYCDDLIDLKTGKMPAWAVFQTIGYARRVSVPDRPRRPIRRWALELPGDGRANLVPLNVSALRLVDRRLDEQHEKVFLGAVSVSRWRRGL